MALEGLKQSGNTAQSDNVKHLTQVCALNQCVHEPTIFTKTFPNKTEKGMLLLLIWIDDIWVAYTKGSKLTTYDPFISAYKKKYSIKEMGEIKLFIKIAMTRDRIKRTITLSQETYITEIRDGPQVRLQSPSEHDLPSQISVRPCWQVRPLP